MDPPAFAKPIVTNSESLWLQHRELLHHLYIKENKTLKQVKDFMESEHKLPTLRLHDYEVALRDVLKLRKNLKKEAWHSIGIHLSNRKRQGKESEVLWNSVPLAAKKVQKDVLRNRKMNQLCYRSRTAELPVGVVIRTPPGSPSRQLAIIGPPETFHLGSEQVSPASHINLLGIFQAGSMRWDVKPTDLEPAEVEISRFRHLRKNIPLNRFICEFLELAKSYPPLTTLSTERTWIPEPRLFGINPSLDMMARVTYHLSNRMSIDWTSDGNSWFLNWLGVSADFAMLRSFFSIKTPTVCAAYEELCDLAERMRKSTVARVLFEMRDTMRRNSSTTADGVDFLTMAVLLRPRSLEMIEIVKRALESETQPLDTGKVRSLFLSAAARRDIAIMRLLVNAVSGSDGKINRHLGKVNRLFASIDRNHDGAGYADTTYRNLALVIRQLCFWEPDERKDGATIADYVQLLIRGRILLTSRSAWCCYSHRPEVDIVRAKSLTIDELVMFCPPMKRRNLYSAILPWSTDHISRISKAGVFAIAPEGPQKVQQYLRSCEQSSDFEIRATMQECLLFASSLNDTQTAWAMLQLGVDPQVPLMSNNKKHYKRNSSRNPMIVAAAAASLETLQLLGGTADLVRFLKSAPVDEIVRPKNRFEFYLSKGTELCRLESFRRKIIYSKIHDSDDAVANGTMGDRYSSEALEPDPCLGSLVVGKRHMETITWIRTIAAAYGMVESLDKAIIAAALFIDPATRGMKCSHETYHPCDVLMLDGLVDANLDYHEGDMDLLQLSIRAECGLKVVELLISKGLRVHSRAARQSGNTMLHEALLSWSHDRSKIVHLLLREGAEYAQSGQGLSVLEASLHGVNFSKMPWYLQKADYVAIFTYLFEAGAPVRHPRRQKIEEWQPLICRLLDVEAADDLILQVVDAGADLNERGRSCYSGFRWDQIPLNAAILTGREKLARELIRRGADVHAPAGNDRGFTALQAACWAGNSLEFVDYLVRVQGANVNEAPSEKSGYTALQAAAEEGSLNLAEFLLDNGADVNALSGKNEHAWLPHRCRALDYASYFGRLDMIEFLLKAGGRSGTGNLDGAIHASKEFECSAVRSVLLDWKKKHGLRIVEEEMEWQRQHPDAGRLFLDM